MEYNKAFLESKGLIFRPKDDFYISNVLNAKLIYAECLSNAQINGLKQKFETSHPGYLWIYVNNTRTIFLSRPFGENKIFFFTPTATSRGGYIQKKTKLLHSLTINRFDDLFDTTAVFTYFYHQLWLINLELAETVRQQNNITDYQTLIISQRILNMVIFTYFCCERGLIVEQDKKKDKKVISGKIFFKWLQEEGKIFSQLKKIFFDFLRIKHDLNTIFLRLGTRSILIPYLGDEILVGGKKDSINALIREKSLKVDDFEWKKLFDLFNSYS
ncbi:MAG: hypothetical protein ACFFBD_26630, partial [Candidatus Hodarchaeota archaeon]